MCSLFVFLDGNSRQNGINRTGFEGPASLLFQGRRQVGDSGGNETCCSRSSAIELRSRGLNAEVHVRYVATLLELVVLLTIHLPRVNLRPAAPLRTLTESMAVCQRDECSRFRCMRQSELAQRYVPFDVSDYAEKSRRRMAPVVNQATSVEASWICARASSSLGSLPAPWRSAWALASDLSISAIKAL